MNLRFSDNVIVHEMHVWKFASRAARSGECWQRIARDSARFRMRIGKMHSLISPILTSNHREIAFSRVILSNIKCSMDEYGPYTWEDGTPLKEYKKPIVVDKYFNDAMCAICTVDFKEESDKTFIQCGHCFHGFCLDRVDEKICPLCRSKIELLVKHENILCRNDANTPGKKNSSGKRDVSKTN